MANTFVIACPECDKQMKVAEDLVGKKIRCRECQAIFAVEKPKGAPEKKAPEKKAPEKMEAKGSAEKEEDAAKAKKNAEMADDEDDGKNPYGLVAIDEGNARCPHCAKELESNDAKVCLHCGFNVMTRTKPERKAVYEPTGQEKFQWLLPAFICIAVMLVLITLCVAGMFKTKGWMEDSFLQDEKDKTKYMVKPGCFMLFSGMATAFVCFQLGKFAYKRLVTNNKPPERIIQEDDEKDDED